MTLATRVRTDIMRAISKKFSTDKEEMFVTAFTSRPILHIRNKEEGLVVGSVSLTFSDSVSRFGGSLTEEDLGEAYRRAGVVFRGQLQQNFVVLHDKSWKRPERASTGASAGVSGRPQKRMRESGGKGAAEKKHMKS